MLVKGFTPIVRPTIKGKAEWIICTLIKGWYGNFLLKDLEHSGKRGLCWFVNFYNMVKPH